MAFRADGTLDPTKALFVVCLGRKGSGKSQLARVIFNSYPYDRVVIDAAGDDGPTPADSTDRRPIVRMPEPIPAKWPEQLRDEDRPMTLWYLPDPGSPTYLEDMDQVIGLAYTHRRTMVLVHEMGEIATSGKTPARTRRAERLGRHRQLSLLQCNDRPYTLDPRVIRQADLGYIFDLPGRNDREYVADTIGWDRDAFGAAMAELRRYEYLRYDALAPKPEPGEPDRRLLHFPALPEEVIRAAGRTSGH